MEFSIHYDIESPLGKKLTSIPNKEQPVEAESMEAVLKQLGKGLPSPLGCKVTKVVVEEIK